MASLKVYKYELPELNSLRDGQYELDVLVPVGAQFLHLDYQHGKPCIWALVDPEEHLIEIKPLYSVGTGHGSVNPGDQYVGTVKNSLYVWHIFARNNK